jgi:hypothetical protein
MVNIVADDDLRGYQESWAPGVVTITTTGRAHHGQEWRETFEPAEDDRSRTAAASPPELSQFPELPGIVPEHVAVRVAV